MDALRRRAKARAGKLIIIGGHEAKEGDMRVLRAVVEHKRRGAIVVATLASDVAEELWPLYRKAFRTLGARKVEHLEISQRDDAYAASNVRRVAAAGAVFLTGGSQLRITSKLGGTPVAAALCELHARGGVIAGTSAGASAMSETMLVSGPGLDSARLDADIQMAPGLGFVRELVVDQHFAKRGRIGRLMAVVAQNPRLLGVGVDEDTAIVLDPSGVLSVVGSNGVYVVDGHAISRSNVSEGDTKGALSVDDVRLHLLADGDGFDLTTRRPVPRRRS